MFCLQLTHPQFKTFLYARLTFNRTASTLQDATGFFKYPQIQGTYIIVTQVGAQSVVCLSGLELTVKQTRTPFQLLDYSILFTIHELCPNSVCPTPTIIKDQ